MAVANWFIQKNMADGHGKPLLDQMKLHKLVFYAHAWYLANFHRELYPEDVEAWPHGPVVRDIYGQFKKFGRQPITEYGQRLKIEDGNVAFEVPMHDGSLDYFFEAIWENYSDYSGIQLSNMTHESDEPWTKVAQQYNFDLSDKPTIPSEIIESCFVRKLEK